MLRSSWDDSVSGFYITRTSGRDVLGFLDLLGFVSVFSIRVHVSIKDILRP